MAGDWASGALVGYLACVGAWRSLVARTVRVGEVPGSNPGAPLLQLAPHIPAVPRKPPQTLGFSERCAGLCGAVRCVRVCRCIAAPAETYCKTFAAPQAR